MLEGSEFQTETAGGKGCGDPGSMTLSAQMSVNAVIRQRDTDFQKLNDNSAEFTVVRQVRYV